MSYGFLDVAMTPSVRAAQREPGAGSPWTEFMGYVKVEGLISNNPAAPFWPNTRHEMLG